jgi:hypothetical protein
VSVSDLLRRENIDIESHIFLDNGADGQDIKQFGLQLLALIEENLVTDNEQGIMLFTPCFSDRFPTELVSPTNISTYGTLVVSVMALFTSLS